MIELKVGSKSDGLVFLFIIICPKRAILKKEKEKKIVFDHSFVFFLSSSSFPLRKIKLN